jgi:hypothetical protein
MLYAENDSIKPLFSKELKPEHIFGSILFQRMWRFFHPIAGFKLGGMGHFIRFKQNY